MIHLLDTDHITLVDRGGQEGQNIEDRLAHIAPQDIFASVVNYEEQMRGWLDYTARIRNVDRQPAGYYKLERMLNFYCKTQVLPFNEQAVEEFQRLWVQRIRIGTMDLKIAAIALANEAILLTRNLADFGKVPGLRVEDWSV